MDGMGAKLCRLGFSPKLNPPLMRTPETSRELCPDRFLDDIGCAFGMGAVGGTAFHFLNGVYNGPLRRAPRRRCPAMRMNAPCVGGSFSGRPPIPLRLRHGLSPLEGGPLELHRLRYSRRRLPPDAPGSGPAARSALFGGILFGLIEGASIMLNRFLSFPQGLPPLDVPALGMPPNVASAMANAGSGASFAVV